MLNDLLELVGASPLLIGILAIFWKGDDALSESFKSDLSAWLLRKRTIPIKNPWITFTRQLSDKYFGEKLFSIRSFLKSAIISGAFVIILCSVFVLSNWINGIDPALAASKIYGIGIICLALNAVIDFISIVQTRFFLKKAETTKRYSSIWLGGDFIVSAIISFVLILLFFLSLIFTGVIERFGFSLVWLINTLWWIFFIEDEAARYWFFNFKVSHWQIFALIPSITTFSTTIWIWLSALGTIFFRLTLWSKPIRRWLIYALPIEVRPIRSIGVTLSILVLIIISFSKVTL